jgi:hypothetical protein
MYINDIAEKLISLTRLFADDTSFSYSNRDELQIKTVIDHDLKELVNFSAISLIYIINNRGTSTDLWGTPAETLQSEEDDLFIDALCCFQP